MTTRTPTEGPTTSMTPQMRRVLRALAVMSEAVAKASRFLADGQDAEAEGALLSISQSVRRELDEEGGD